MIRVTGYRLLNERGIDRVCGEMIHCYVTKASSRINVVEAGVYRAIRNHKLTMTTQQQLASTRTSIIRPSIPNYQYRTFRRNDRAVRPSILYHINAHKTKSNFSSSTSHINNG